MSIILLGAPGSGKGTQGDYIVERFGMYKFSTGDALRACAADMNPENSTAAELREIMKSGKLVDDALVMKIVSDFLDANQDKTFIFDGFPRNLKQAEFLDELLAKYPSKPNLQVNDVIFFDMDLKKLKARITNRVFCADCSAVYNLLTSPPEIAGTCDTCSGTNLKQRSDDSLETLEVRLKEYSTNTLALVEYYKKNGLLRSVAAEASMEEVSKEIERILGE